MGEVAEGAATRPTRSEYRERGNPVTLVSDNTAEFAAPKDLRVFHPDLAADFAGLAVENSANVASTVAALSVEPASSEDLVRAFDEFLETRESKCSNFGAATYGHWRNSQFGGGLRWHLTCPSYGRSVDTGDFWE